jgi:hypothetical protein
MMQKLFIPSTASTPEINFSPEENILLIKGRSSPEDVRAMYYPVIEWVRKFTNSLIESKSIGYTSEKPLRFQSDLIYFNSSSAKFLYDIFSELKKLSKVGNHVVIEWFYEEEDLDLKEAGIDIALLAEMEFTFIPKNRNRG